MKYIFLLLLFIFVSCVPGSDAQKAPELSDPRLPKVTIAATQTVNENAGSTAITVSINHTTSRVITVPLTLHGGATGGGTDYSTPSSITIQPGQLTGSTTLTITNDALIEGNETIVVVLGNTTNALNSTNNTQIITIVDDEVTSTLPNVTFSAGTQSVGEGAGTATITATLSSAATFNVYVPVNVATYSATTNATNLLDYTVSTNVISIPAGSTNGTLTVTLVDDALYEGNEVVYFSMGTPVNANLGATTTHLITIAENESLSISFMAAAQTINEAGTSVPVYISLSNPSATPVDFTVTVSGSSTASGSGVDFNYTKNGLTLQVPANTLATYTNVAIIDDNLFEGTTTPESIIVTLGATAPVTVGVPSTHTISITESDAAPVLYFNTTSVNYTETAGTILIPVTASIASSTAYTVSYAISGTAVGVETSTPDHDQNLTGGGTFTMPANSTTKNISVALEDDSYGESPETAIFTLQAGTDYTVNATNYVYTINLTDDDPTPIINFSSTISSVSETAGTTSITVSLSNPSGTTISAIIAQSGTATNLTDYGASQGAVSLPGTIQLSPGETSTTIAISLLDDTLDENTETAVFTMSSPTNANLGSLTTHTMSISDNDTAPTLSFALSAAAIAENSGGSVVLTATASTASGLPITIPYSLTGTATASTDYSPTSATGNITISAGATTGSLTITPTDDSTYESSETIIYTTTTPTNASGTTTSTITLTDNESVPNVSFSAATSSLTENNTTHVVTANLSGASSENISVSYSVAGSGTYPASGSGIDYTLPSGAIVFTAGTTSKTINVPIYEDTTDEYDEEFTLSMSTTSGAVTFGATTTHAITITDDDVLLNFSTTAVSTTEISGSQVLTVNVNNLPGNVAPSNITATINLGGTAISGTDYSLSSTSFSIPAASGSTTIAISLTDENLNEDAETINVSLSSITGATMGTASAVTVTVSSSDPVSSMGIGFEHACAVKQTDVTSEAKCFGLGSSYQLGNNLTSSLGDESGEMGASLAALSFASSYPIQIASGKEHSCSLMADSTIYCWGSNTYGQLGIGASYTHSTTPAIIAGITGSAIAVGDYHSCILKSDYTIYCFGLNSSGQLGQNNTTDLFTPTQVNSITGAYEVTAGGNHTCARMGTASIKCWGYNGYGQLGTDTTDNKGDTAGEMALLTSVAITLPSVSQISAGQNHSCAISASGKAQCFGRNNYGQLGQDSTYNYGSTTSSISLLTDINFGTNLVSEIRAGGNFTCVRFTTSNDVKCFGENTYGQLGQENVTTLGDSSGEMAALDAIDFGSGKYSTALSLGSNSVCSKLNNGRMKCWGKNTSGQLGQGTTSHKGDGASEMGSSLSETEF